MRFALLISLWAFCWSSLAAIPSARTIVRDRLDREILECDRSQERYEFLQNTEVFCGNDYLHFEERTSRLNPPNNLKVAAFNILRLGTNQSRFKRFDFLARLISKWDLVAVVEIMPTPLSRVDHNLGIDTITSPLDKATPEKAQLVENSYRMPGYLSVLKELKKINSSWSLIMSAIPSGENIRSYELSGFYYRADRVQNLPTTLCQGKTGCLLHVPSEYDRLISRLPFVAKFHSGDFESTLLTVHSRFRAPQLDRLTTSERRLIDSYKIVGNQLEKYRFIELDIINKALGSSRQEALFAGDFNLDYDSTPSSSNFRAWHQALGAQSQVLVTEPTSVSADGGLNNSYDHFVMHKSGRALQKRCQAETARAFSFLVYPEGPAGNSLRAFRSFLREKQTDAMSILDRYINRLESKQKPTYCEGQFCQLQFYYSEQTIRRLTEEYDNRVLAERPYNTHIEFYSDHLPITMSCATN